MGAIYREQYNTFGSFPKISKVLKELYSLSYTEIYGWLLPFFFGGKEIK